MTKPMVNSSCTSKLTSFSPYNDEEGQKHSILKKLFSGDTVAVSSNFRISGSCNDLIERNPSSTLTADDHSSTETGEATTILPIMGATGSFAADASRQQSFCSGPSSGRNLYNVLSGLKRIIAGKGKTPQAYRDSDFKQYWMPDSNCKECYECGCKFSLFRRRHHCRICGQIFCSACCSQEVPGKTIGYTGSLRCCDYCMKVVNQYIPESEAADLPDPHAPQWSSRPDDPQGYVVVDAEDHPSRGGAPESSGANGTLSSSATAYNGTLRRGSALKPSIFDDDKKGSKSGVELDASPHESLQKERKALLQESCHLHELWFSMRTSISMQSFRYILKTYDNCMQASQIVNWLIDNDKAMSREQAVVLGQALLDGNWLESLDGKVIFKDNPRVFYRPTEMALRSRPDDANGRVDHRGGASSSSSLEGDGEPLWVREILRREGDESPNGVVAVEAARESGERSSVERLLAEASQPISEPPGTQQPPAPRSTFYLGLEASKEGQTDCRDTEGIGGTEGQGIMKETKVEDLEAPFLQTRPHQDSTEAFIVNENREKLKTIFQDHLSRLTNQLLKKNHLDPSWAEWITAIGRTVTNSVRPNARLEDEMDIRHYVKFKKMEGGERSQWQTINGVVFSKNVSHKKDRQAISNPRILLLSAPIEYQRIENKMSSLEPQILQEREFLKKCVHRIITMRPEVLLVEKTVSRIAREYLHEAGIALVVNVKQSVMHRVSRMTQATIVSSIDELVNKTNLGTCRQFYLHAYAQSDGSSKTLMFLDGCCPSLGCSVILRGASLQELQRVKSVLKFLIYSMHHLNLEMSFLMDENAYLAKGVEFGRCQTRGRRAENEMAADCDARKKVDSTQLKNDNASSEKPKSSKTSHDIRSRELKFRNCISNEVILSISPLVRFEPPYLETAEGQLSPVRTFFTAEDLYWSEELEKEDDKTECDGTAANRDVGTGCGFGDCDVPSDTENDKACHPFTSRSLQSTATRPTVQNLLADFRARGGKSLPENESDAILKKKFSTPPPPPAAAAEASNRSTTFQRHHHQFDCLALEGHQKISVLFSSVSLESPNFPSPCVLPWTVTMAFYSQTDITLGGFLEKFCYNESYRCINTRCDVPMRDHVRRFVHGSGCIQVTLKKVESPTAAPSGSASNQASGIKLWSYCKLCLQKTPVSLLSSESYCLSFGKYLELRFHGSDYVNRPGSRCSHSLHKDYVQIFDCGSIRAAFKFIPITILDICPPPMVITTLPLKFLPDNLYEEGIMLNYRVEYLFDSIMENLSKLKREMVTSDGQNSILTHHIIQLEVERQSMDQKVEYVISMVKNLKQLKEEMGDDSTKAQSSLGLQIADAYIGLHRNISSTCQVWSDKLAELEAILKKSSKSITASINNSQQNSCSGNLASLGQNSIDIKVSTSGSTNTIVDSGSVVGSDSGLKVEGGLSPATESPTGVSPDHLKKVSSFPIDLVDCSREINRESRSTEELALPRIGSSPGSASVFRSESSVSPLAALGKEGRDEKPSEGDASCETTTLLPPPASCIDDASADPSIPASLIDGRKEEEEEEEDRGDKKSATQPASLASDVAGENAPLSAVRPGLKKMKHSASSKESSMSEMGGGQSKVNMKQILSNFLSNSSSCSIDDPIPPDEHHLLQECYKVPVVVYDKELSSVIAYALSSEEYSVKMSELNRNVEDDTSSTPHKNGELDEGRRSSVKLSFLNAREKDLPSSDLSSALNGYKDEQNSSFDTVRYVHQDSDSIEDRESISEESTALKTQKPTQQKLESQAATNRSQQQNNQQHIKLQFSDATTKFYCEICYAKQFDDLRKLVYQDGEERFIRSLSRCVTWFARGGKSGSNFCKTKDNRFILKQMSLKEIQSFGTFAPNYFDHILDCIRTGRPTTLAKIVGVFKVVFQNSRTTETVSQDLIVMENLFYNKNINKIYDLKGSMRNRMVDTLGKSYEDVVLLDENLIRAMVDSPMYVHGHAKVALTTSITMDTEFLANNLVMDYSLLVGVDEKNQLVVGIIDYLRTFTWDKRVEMIFKNTYGSKMPTVVSPEIYRRRFLDAMDRYFLAVPDKWKGLGRSLSEALL